MGFMKTSAELVAAVFESINAAAGTDSRTGPAPGSESIPVDPLRKLAFLQLALNAAMNDAAASVSGSPVRAAALTQLAEGIYRSGSHGQILAAGACADTEANTLTESCLSALNQSVANLADFASGVVTLPPDAVTGADRKPLHHDPAEFLKTQLHLGYFQAQHRINSSKRLTYHRGIDGAISPPSCPQLAQILVQGAIDPRIVANAAAKFVALDPALDAQPDPAAARSGLESRIARTLATADEATVGKFIKQEGIGLETSITERAEELTARFLGLRFRGHKPTGFLWEMTVDAEGHELLCTMADDLNNPRTASGKATQSPRSGTGNTTERSVSDDTGQIGRNAPDQPPLIPAWAVNPDMPEVLRPRAGFTDVGQRPSGVDPWGLGIPDLLPGESPEAANSRRRAQHLSQAVLDSIRSSLDPETPTDPDMPMKSRVELLVMIDYDVLAGLSQKPGITARGEKISAAEARRLACNAGILPIVMGGASQPLDLGQRRRFFSRAQKRAISARDRGCANPGCSMPPHRSEVHHIVPFSQGGKTDIGNGLLLCIRCHTAFHAGHFTIRVIDGLPHVVLPKSRDPIQRPMRNWVFHPEAAAS